MTDKQIIENKNGFYCIEPCSEIKQLKEQLKAKEQECEELKAKCKKYREINEQETKDYAELKAENERLQEEREKAKNYNLEYGQLLIKATNKNNKLSKTLAEIKEIAEEKAKVNDWLALDILQKINEVEDD